jgi:hypothetical protein
LKPIYRVSRHIFDKDNINVDLYIYKYIYKILARLYIYIYIYIYIYQGRELCGIRDSKLGLSSLFLDFFKEVYYKKLLNDFKERKDYFPLKEEAVDRTMWRARFGPVVRQTAELMNECYTTY